jgi:hypothetical protein
MKLPLEDAADAAAITKPVDDKAGVEYETIKGVENVVQLDRLNADHALVLVQAEGGPADLKTMALP